MRAVDYAKTHTPVPVSGESGKNSNPLRISAPARPRVVAAAGVVIAVVITGIAIAAHVNRAPADNDLVMLTQAADAGENGAELQLALAYREGRLGLAADEKRAEYWLHRAALDGNSYAAALEQTPTPPGALQRISGFLSEVGSIFTRGSSDRLQADAQAGDALAQFQLAMRYRDGSFGVERDDAASRLWLERSAKGGDKVAMTTLARAYGNGDHGFPRDPQQSRLWQERAAAIN